MEIGVDKHCQAYNRSHEGWLLGVRRNPGVLDMIAHLAVISRKYCTQRHGEMRSVRHMNRLSRNSAPIASLHQKQSTVAVVI